jgi:predicted RNA-binding protein
MKYWILVTHPKNFELMKAKNIAAMKAKRKSFALAVEPGDKVAFYLTKIGKFGGIAEFITTAREEKNKIFEEEKPGEVHPWRFDVKWEVKLPEDKYVPSENFKDKLVYLKKWPAKYWRLGFQGNIHEVPKEDYEALKKGMNAKS